MRGERGVGELLHSQNPPDGDDSETNGLALIAKTPRVADEQAEVCVVADRKSWAMSEASSATKCPLGKAIVGSSAASWCSRLAVTVRPAILSITHATPERRYHRRRPW